MAGPAKVIVDASVALKWFLDEDGTPDALALRDVLVHRVAPVVPSLFFYEIANVLRYTEEFGIEDVKHALAALVAFQFSTRELSGDLAARCVEIAYTFGLTVYDAAYVALGDIMNAPVITADEKLLQKVRGKNVVHLRDWARVARGT